MQAAVFPVTTFAEEPLTTTKTKTEEFTYLKTSLKSSATYLRGGIIKKM